MEKLNVICFPFIWLFTESYLQAHYSPTISLILMSFLYLRLSVSTVGQQPANYTIVDS
jgi:hypothetical protein